MASVRYFSCEDRDFRTGKVSFSAVACNDFSSGLRQAWHAGAPVGCLPCGDNLKPGVSSSHQDLTMSVSEGFFLRKTRSEGELW